MSTTSTAWKEVRRLQALTLKQAGWKHTEIAEALGVTDGTVSQWMSLVEEQGAVALLARPHTGRPPELTSAQKSLLPDYLSHGAEAYGFRGNVWTCERVAKVIEWEWGVVYHRSHVARLLKALKWTPQLPLERASQRDEAAIALWRTETWPELKKEHGWNAEALFLWMNRASICCLPRCAPMRRVVSARRCACIKHVIICR